MTPEHVEHRAYDDPTADAALGRPAAQQRDVLTEAFDRFTNDPEFHAVAQAAVLTAAAKLKHKLHDDERHFALHVAAVALVIASKQGVR